MPFDPSLKSFVPVSSDSDFPIQNLPMGVFRRQDEEAARCGVRIGDYVVDLRALESAGLFRSTAMGSRHVFAAPSLNGYLALGAEVWRSVRERLIELLRSDVGTLRDDTALREKAVLPLDLVELDLPTQIGDYTDFYSSKHHAFNVGSMFRGPENALMPNYTWIPVGYHGRASSVVLSGTQIRRPCGQTKADDADAPQFGPSRLLDFELEMGFLTGPATELGSALPIAEAESRIFGMVILNDWSARDVQKWEYVPLGPFLAKNFATTISPWIVSLEALEPFRCANPETDHDPIPYLAHPDHPVGHGYDIQLEVLIQTAGSSIEQSLCRSNFKYLYWTMVQQLAHHTATGCNIRPGDLMGSGTISGPAPGSFGSMLELCWRGERPIQLQDGEERRFLQDGDTIIMRARGERDGVRIGFGECRGTVTPAEGA